MDILDDIALGSGYHIHYVDDENNRNIYYNNQGVFTEVRLIEVGMDEKYILVWCFLGNRSPYFKQMSGGQWFKIDKEVYSKDPSQELSKGIKEIDFFSYSRHLKNCESYYDFKNK